MISLMTYACKPSVFGKCSESKANKLSSKFKSISICGNIYTLESRRRFLMAIVRLSPCFLPRRIFSLIRLCVVHAFLSSINTNVNISVEREILRAITYKMPRACIYLIYKYLCGWRNQSLVI